MTDTNAGAPPYAADLDLADEMTAAARGTSVPAGTRACTQKHLRVPTPEGVDAIAAQWEAEAAWTADRRQYRAEHPRFPGLTAGYHPGRIPAAAPVAAARDVIPQGGRAVTQTRCDSDEALEGITARWAARGQQVCWAWDGEDEGAYVARLRDEHGRVIEVAVLAVEVTASGSAA
jgi:hypothetical protein